MGDEMNVVALVPAHNEDEQITATVRSMLAQELRPAQVVVVADNCTDDTAELARAAGASVLHTIGNTGKKAGALNQGLAMLLPLLADDDVLVVADADGELPPGWTRAAVGHLGDESLGAVCAQVLCKPVGRGALALLQWAEYAQGARKVSRRGGRVWVLSGAAVAMKASVAKRLLAERGFVYDEKSLTEDYEFTLALRELGYDTRGFKDLEVETDVMLTWRDLYRQRLRWQRGTLETLWSYGFGRVTRKAWATQAGVYSASLLFPLSFALWAWVGYSGASPDLRWLAVLPLFGLDQLVTSWRAGWKAALLSATLVPMIAYGAFVLATGWVALIKAVKGSGASWA